MGEWGVELEVGSQRGRSSKLSRNSCFEQAWDRERRNFHTGRDALPFSSGTAVTASLQTVVVVVVMVVVVVVSPQCCHRHCSKYVIAVRTEMP